MVLAGLFEDVRYRRSLQQERRWSRGFTIASLSDDDFRRWVGETAVDELGQMLFWTWEPVALRKQFPDRHLRSDAAGSILAGLRAGDDFTAFRIRIRANTSQGSPSVLALATRLTSLSRMSTPVLFLLHRRIHRWATRSILEWRSSDERRRLRDLPFQMHLSKYDPEHWLRGSYDDGTWTDVADVGGTFREGVLTLEKYEAVEAAHVDVLLEVCHEAGISSLVRWEFDGHGVPQPGAAGPVAVEEFGLEIRRMLRGDTTAWIWVDPDLRLYIARGYDFHVYAGSHRDAPGAVRLAEELGLFPEVGHVDPSLLGD